MIHTFSLQTFLKLSLLSTGERIAEIQKKLDGSDGYDFYNSLTKATKLRASGSEQSDIDDTLDYPTRAVERKYNREAFDVFDHKFGKSRSLEDLKNRGKILSPDKTFQIIVEPTFSASSKGVRVAYCLWATQKPEMTQRYGAVGCYVMRQALKNTPLANYQFAIYDLVGKKQYSEKQISNNTSLIFKADCGSISALLKSL